MNQFRKILSFELKNYFTNKIFVGITLFLVAAIAVVMFLPGIMDLVREDETPETAGIQSGAEIETAEDDGRAVMLVLLPEDEPELGRCSLPGSRNTGWRQSTGIWTNSAAGSLPGKPSVPLRWILPHLTPILWKTFP